MTKTWEEIRKEFEEGIGFSMNHLTKFKWEQFESRRLIVWCGLKEDLYELEHVLICENTAYNGEYRENKGSDWLEYYNEAIIINNYLLGAIDVLKERV